MFFDTRTSRLEKDNLTWPTGEGWKTVWGDAVKTGKDVGVNQRRMNDRDEGMWVM